MKKKYRDERPAFGWYFVSVILLNIVILHQCSFDSTTLKKPFQKITNEQFLVVNSHGLIGI